jgi:hypothetical protein
MVQYQNKPLSGDQRNASQLDLLNNSLYLLDLTGDTGITPAGTLAVDHQMSGNDVTTPTDGFHNQVSMPSRSTPSSQTNAVNGEIAAGILYTTTDTGGTEGEPHAILKYVIGTDPTDATKYIDYPISCIQAFACFNSTGTVNGNAFNINFPITPVTSGSQRSWTIVFTQPLSSYLYGVSVNLDSPFLVNTDIYFVSIIARSNVGFVIRVNSFNNENPYAGTLNVIVYGIF